MWAVATVTVATRFSKHAVHQISVVTLLTGWLGSRVVSVLDGLRRRRARVQIAVATLSDNSLRQTVHTHCASVHQAAKLVAALLMVAGVTVGLAESKWQPTARFMTHVTCRLTAKNRDQLRNPTLGNRTYGLPLPFYFTNRNNCCRIADKSLHDRSRSHSCSSAQTSREADRQTTTTPRHL